MYGIYEIKNRMALHGMFNTIEEAINHLYNIVPIFIDRSYFTDKTLTVKDFEIRQISVDDIHRSHIKSKIQPSQ